MKIYNKKVFASGVFEMALGLLLLITSIVRQDLSAGEAFISAPDTTEFLLF